jgi:inosose dehydratase
VKKIKMTQTRLNFLKTIGLGAIISQANSISAKNISAKTNLNLGLASYTLRDYSLEDTIKYAKGLDLTHIALKSMHLPLDSKPEYIKEVIKKISDAGLKLYGAGVIYMKTDAEVENAFNYAQTAGIEMIIGVPNHELLPLVEKKVKETGIKLAIHNHGPGDKVYPTPDTVYEHIKNLDNRIGMCIDVGHVVRLGLDPVKNILKYGNKLFDMHLKDVNKVAEDSSSVEIGRGVIDIPAILKALQKINYKGVMAIEYEKDGKTAIIGLSESVGYVRGIMKMV